MKHNPLDLIKSRFEKSKRSEQLELLRACASDNSEESHAALTAMAAVLSLVVEQVLPILDSSSIIFRDWKYNPDVDTVFPLELFVDAGLNTVRVWSQQTGGGLPTSEVRGVEGFKFSPYLLNSAASAKKKVIKNATVDFVALLINRMLQEILQGRELNAWGTIMAAAGGATTNNLPGGPLQTITATTPDIFQVHDFNRLKTAIARLHNSWVGGTPAPGSIGRRGLTDMFLSPEMMEQIRSWAYQPMNTRGVPNSDESTAVALPDAIRTAIWGNSNVPEIFGVKLHELNEFGVGQRYNTLFDTFYSAAGGTFDGATQEIILGLDLSVDAFIRPIASKEDLDIDTSPTFQVRVDDQFPTRQETVGWYGKQEEAYVVLDRKTSYGIIV